MSRLFEDMQLGDIELFALAADAGSFTIAAEQAGLTPGAVSRCVARLEARLGVRLFVRTTRHIRLTDAGLLYLRQSRQALAQLIEVERQLSGQQLQPKGVLRISLPSSYGRHRVLPLLPRFRLRHPNIDLEVQLSNRNVDFAEEAFDLAIRARTPADSRLVARKIEDAQLVVVASPAYLARAGEPRTPEDLSAHECVQFVLPSSGRCMEWVLKIGGKDVEMATRGHIVCSDELDAGIYLAKHGAGLYQTYRFMVERELQAGELVEVLARFGACTRPFSVVYPQTSHMPARVRALLDFLFAELGQGQAEA